MSAHRSGLPPRDPALDGIASRRTGLSGWGWAAIGLAGAVLLAVAWLGLGQRPATAFDLSRHSVPLDQIVDGGPGKDGIPALLSPTFVLASGAWFLKEDDRVLGLSVDTEAKAYPVKILNWHELVNDAIGGKPVVVTYCPLCGTGIAFDARADGRRFTFGVSGLLYQSDLLMYDHQTESLWSQIAMQAVAGPLTGTKLTPLFLEHTTWGEWRRAYPHTLVLSVQTGYIRDYERDPYRGYADRRELMFDTTYFDPSYHPKEWVLGVEIDRVAKAYPFAELKKVATPLVDQVGGRRITVHFNARARSASVTTADGTPAPSLMAYWFAWYAFHPDTEVFKAN